MRKTAEVEPLTTALIGAKGMLAQMVVKRTPQNFRIAPFDLPEFDITDKVRVEDTLGRVKPRVIINCAAMTDVDGCEKKEALATRINADGPGILAAFACKTDATLVHISTDYVFSGWASRPYREDDPTSPLSAYGRSKLAGEEAIIASGLKKFFIIRTSWLYGPGGKNFVETILRLAAERDELKIVADQVGSPTFTGDLARAIFSLLTLNDRNGFGIYHFSNQGQCSWHEFAVEIVRMAAEDGVELSAKRVIPIKTEEFPLPAPRPAYSVFDKALFCRASGSIIPEWRAGLREYFSIRHQV